MARRGARRSPRPGPSAPPSPFAALLLAAAVAAAASTASAAASFDGSADLLINPERGFRWEFDSFPSLDGLADAIALNVSIAQCYAYLPAAPVPLNSSFLSALDAGFGALRVAGLKAVLRFAYDRLQPGENNYTFETIELHQLNLAWVVAKNADVIFVLEAGFVGSWGEWHSSMNGLEANETALSALVANELYGGLGLPPTTFVMLRYRALKDKVLRPTPPLSAAQQAAWPAMTFGIVDSGSAGSQAAFARLGYHNDGFLSTGSDGDTYYADLPAAACGASAVPIVPLFCSLDGPMVDAAFAVTTLESPYVPIGGEMYWSAGANGSGTLVVDGHTAAHRLRMQHFTYLSIVHGLAPYGRGGRGRGRGRDGNGGRGALTATSENINAWMATPLNISRIWNCGGPTWWPCEMPLPPAYAAALPNRSVFEYIRDLLGYRVQLNSADFPAAVALGDELTVSARVTNFGFAAPVSPRLVYIVLIDAMADAIAFITHFPGVDASSWMPHVPGDPALAPLEHFMGASPLLAAGALAPGNYSLGLFLPDATPGASNASAFSVRLANRACATIAEAGSGGCAFWWADRGGAGGVNVIGQVQVTAN